MSFRSGSRWIVSLLIALVALVVMNGLLAQPGAQARPATTTICLGSIQACIDAALDGDTIVIPEGTYTESLTLSKPVSLTGVNSATTILHAVAGQRVLTVTGASIDNSVVISGLTFSGGKLASGWSCPDSCGGGLLLMANAQPLFHHIIISHNTANYRGGGIYANLGSPITLVNVILISNTANNIGGGLYTHDALVEIGSSFIDNAAVLGDGGAYAAKSVTLNGGRFESNHSSLGVGGLESGSAVNMLDTQFISNVASAAVGGLYASGPAILVGGHFESNIALGNTGAVFAFSTLTISGTQFISNSASAQGGAVYANKALTLIGGVFKGNQCINRIDCQGGGLMHWSDSLIVTGTQFINNLAAIGGGLFHSSGDSRIVNTVFAGNVATATGAAIYHNSGNSQILHGSIASGTSVSGAAVYIGPRSTVYIADTIIANYAIAISNTGGIVYEDYNLFFDNITNTIGVTSGGHSLSGDPHFVDSLNGDYHLRFPSPAIDHGVDASVTTDLDGHPRPIYFGFDIGAFEYQGMIAYVFLPTIRK